MRGECFIPRCHLFIQEIRAVYPKAIEMSNEEGTKVLLFFSSLCVSVCMRVCVCVCVCGSGKNQVDNQRKF